MKTNLFGYSLPQKLIAQSPTNPRDRCKLMLIDRKGKKIRHLIFKDLEKILNTNDVLVLNKTKVFPARIITTKETGGKVEVLFLEEKEPKIWHILTKPGLKPNQRLILEELNINCINQDKVGSTAEINLNKEELFKFLEKYGLTPLPPYIKAKGKEKILREKYQTVFAKETGSAAAPTAGFHFTKNLIKKLKTRGVKIEFITLHIGLGTFLPIKAENIEKHKIHSEYFKVEEDVAKRIFKAKEKGQKIIAVGTTTRVLETIATNPQKLEGKTNLFIYPPYKFKLVDSLITNFHLPKSTLLALISAFVSYPQTGDKFKSFKKSLAGKAYDKAIKENYHFYSFGDACLIL